MDIKQWLREGSWLLAVLCLFSAPIFFKNQPHFDEVTVQFPKSTRQVASVVPSGAGDCHLKQRWRFVCDHNQKNCVKNRKESYLECVQKTPTKGE